MNAARIIAMGLISATLATGALARGPGGGMGGGGGMGSGQGPMAGAPAQQQNQYRHQNRHQYGEEKGQGVQGGLGRQQRNEIRATEGGPVQQQQRARIHQPGASGTDAPAASAN